MIIRIQWNLDDSDVSFASDYFIRFNQVSCISSLLEGCKIHDFQSISIAFCSLDPWPIWSPFAEPSLESHCPWPLPDSIFEHSIPSAVSRVFYKVCWSLFVYLWKVSLITLGSDCALSDALIHWVLGLRSNVTNTPKSFSCCICSYLIKVYLKLNE